MRKFAIINKYNGIVEGTIQPATDDMIEDEEVCPYSADSIYKEIEEPMWQSFSKETHWWDGNMWRVRPAPPSEHHKSWSSVTNRWSVDSESLWSYIRKQRNVFLTHSDWTQLPDAPLTQIEKDAWSEYRQSLRNIPANNEEVEFIEEVNWPTPPAT
jgi:hypothetical protein